MRMVDLANDSDSHTDEALQNEDILRFANSAIAFINSRLKVRLPYVESSQEDYSIISDHWQRQIIGNYMSWGIKMQDGSLNEADRFYEMMLLGIAGLEDVMYGDEPDGSGGEIPVEYLDPNELKNRNSVLDTSAFMPSWFRNDDR